MSATVWFAVALGCSVVLLCAVIAATAYTAGYADGRAACEEERRRND